MESSSSNGFDFKQSQTLRINQLISNVCKSDPNLARYSQVAMLLLDRSIFSNLFTLGEFHGLFLLIYGKSTDPKELQDQKAISKDQLFSLLKQIAKTLYPFDEKYFQKFFNKFLSEKVDQQHGEINHARVMVFDSTNTKLITEPSISTLKQYEKELINVFIVYVFENYWSLKKSHRILLSLREITLQNKKWTYPSLIHFLKDSQTTPHLLNIQSVQEVLRLIVPNINNKQNQFYSRHVISDGYHKEVQNNDQTFHIGDPGLKFYEFQLLFARMAYDSFPKDQSDSNKKDMKTVLDRYFTFMGFRKNDQIETKPLPSYSRRMITLMKEFYRVTDAKKVIMGQVQSQDNVQTPYQKVAHKILKNIIEVDQVGMDFHECLKTLERQLPKMPPEPVVQQECPPPYKKSEAITLGQQPPPQPSQGKDKQKVPQKKKEGKKDEIPPRQFLWAKVPETKLSGQDYLKQVQSKLNFQVRPLSDLERGTIKRQCFPVIIGQILFPPQLPKCAAPHVLAARTALAERNYYLAIENFNNGLNTWKDSNIDCDSATQLFFEYSKGCVYLSASKCQHALNQFYLCRKFAQASKIQFTNPDRSLPYFGMGQVFYQMQQYEMAARSFLKARQIRESILGLEHVQTATVFNNLAACYFMLGRSQEALGYIEIAEVILDTQLGQHHQRTMTSRSNLKLISHGSFINKPQYRKFWEVFEEDKFGKKKKKKKQKDGKKKK